MASTIDNETFSRLLLDLYRAAEDVSIGESCQAALHQIQPRLPFDGAIWITSSTASGRPRPSHHVRAIDGLPHDLVRHYESDPDGSAIFAFAREHLGEPHILNFADMAPGSLTATLTSHAGMHQVMVTSEWNETLSAFTGLLLGRRDPRLCFKAEDRSWLRLPMPHLQALALRNVESQIRRTIVNRIAGNVGLANDAILLEQVNFSRWMRTMWPEIEYHRGAAAASGWLFRARPTRARVRHAGRQPLRGVDPVPTALRDHRAGSRAICSDSMRRTRMPAAS